VSSVSRMKGRSLNGGEIISWVSMQIPDSCLLQNALHLENTLRESYKTMLMACRVVQEPRTRSSKKPNTSADNNIDPTLSLESVSVPRGRAKVGQLVASSTFRLYGGYLYMFFKSLLSPHTGLGVSSRCSEAIVA